MSTLENLEMNHGGTWEGAGDCDLLTVYCFMGLFSNQVVNH